MTCFDLLTGVVLHQFLQGGEGQGGRNIVATFVKSTNLIVLDHVTLLG